MGTTTTPPCLRLRAEDTVGVMTRALPAGAELVVGDRAVTLRDDVPAGHAGARFYCDRADVNGVSQALKKAGWTVTTAEMSYVAKNAVEVAAAQRAEVEAFLTAIDEHDDVHRVYTAMK